MAVITTEGATPVVEVRQLSKPVSEMSDDELLAEITRLRGIRTMTAMRSKRVPGGGATAASKIAKAQPTGKIDLGSIR